MSHVTDHRTGQSLRWKNWEGAIQHEGDRDSESEDGDWDPNSDDEDFYKL